MIAIGWILKATPYWWVLMLPIFMLIYLAGAFTMLDWNWFSTVSQDARLGFSFLAIFFGVLAAFPAIVWGIDDL